MLGSASDTRVESACRPDHAPALIVVCNGAAMKKLRVVEQACGCCAVRGKAHSRCVLGSASDTLVESACRPDHAPALTAVCNGAAMKLRVV